MATSELYPGEKIVDRLLGSPKVLEILDPLDPKTREHSIGVALVSGAIAHAEDYSQEDAEVFITGSLLHDVGKVVVGEEILEKPDTLTGAEWYFVELHPTAGYAIVLGHSEKIAQQAKMDEEIVHLASIIALTHHSNKRVNPYPNREVLSATNHGSMAMFDFELGADQLFTRASIADMVQVFLKAGSKEGARAYHEARFKEEGDEAQMRYLAIRSGIPEIRDPAIAAEIEVEINPEAYERSIIEAALSGIVHIDDHPLISQMRNCNFFKKELV